MPVHQHVIKDEPDQRAAVTEFILEITYEFSTNLFEVTVALVDALSLWLRGTVRAEPETVISRAWVQSPDAAE